MGDCLKTSEIHFSGLAEDPNAARLVKAALSLTMGGRIPEVCMHTLPHMLPARHTATDRTRTSGRQPSEYQVLRVSLSVALSSSVRRFCLSVYNA